MFKLSADSNEGFSNRSKDIFAGIDNLAAKSKQKDKSEEKSDSITTDSNATTTADKVTQDFKGRESIFRSPNESGWPPKSSKYHPRGRNEGRGHSGRRPPPPRRRGPKTPDHMINPSKYTKYSLSDVSKDQMSDKSNTRAAFDFLRELKDRKDHKYDEDSSIKEQDSSSSHKVTFKKPIRNHQEHGQPSTSGNVVRDGVKRVMPECVVGQKRSKDKDRQRTSEEPKNKKPKKGLVSLSHLDDDEDDESQL